MRAIELMPNIREMYSDQELLKLAGTTFKKLDGYQTGVRRRPQAFCVGVFVFISPA
jgi:hypothetical protein